MHKLLKCLCFVIFFFKTSSATSQAVFEPTYHTVYPYLSRLAQKGVIELDDVVLPLTKDYIYSKLDELSKNINKLTPLERTELEFYLKEYTLWWRKDPKSGFEGTYSSLLKSKVGDRFRFFSYQDNSFTLNIQPIVGFQGESRDGYSYFKNIKGFSTYGYMGDHLSFSLDFRATSEEGRLGDYLRTFSPETGVIGTKPDFKTFNYNELNAQITGSWRKGKITLGKNYLPIGYGNGGKIILSDKSPSFPQLRLDMSPTGWLSFNYTHAWLNSLVVDSSSIYPTSVTNRFEYQYRDKFLAIHSVTLKPYKGTTLTLGESAIYSDRLKIGYLIPISLFSAMNHYLGELNNNSIANSQIFSQLSLRNLVNNTHIYASFFIDELRLKAVENDSTSSRNHTAYQLGMSVTDFPFRNFFFNIEYTKIQPFAYVHFIPVQTYQNNGYNLGHWIGANSDQIYLELLYRIRRGLEIKGTYQYIRKGTVGTGMQQANDNKYLYPFLWGDVNEYSKLKIFIQHEPIHDLFFRLGYTHDKVENVKSSLITELDQFIMSVNYGF